MCFLVFTGYGNIFFRVCLSEPSAHFKIKLFVVVVAAVVLCCWALVWIPEPNPI